MAEDWDAHDKAEAVKAAEERAERLRKRNADETSNIRNQDDRDRRSLIDRMRGK